MTFQRFLTENSLNVFISIFNAVTCDVIIVSPMRHRAPNVLNQSFATLSRGSFSQKSFINIIVFFFCVCGIFNRTFFLSFFFYLHASSATHFDEEQTKQHMVRSAHSLFVSLQFCISLAVLSTLWLCDVHFIFILIFINWLAPTSSRRITLKIISSYGELLNTGSKLHRSIARKFWRVRDILTQESMKKV